MLSFLCDLFLERKNCFVALYLPLEGKNCFVTVRFVFRKENCFPCCMIYLGKGNIASLLYDLSLERKNDFVAVSIILNSAKLYFTVGTP